MHKSLLYTIVIAAALLAACSGDRATPAEPEPPPPMAFCAAPAGSLGEATAAAAARVPLDSLFAAADAEFGVPAALLSAISFTETRWQMVQGQPEHPGQPLVFGVMGIKGDMVGRAAALAGVTAADARSEAAANVRAAAALLDAWAREMGISRADLGAWAPAAARFSGISLPAGQASYVNDGVYAVLRKGAGGAGERAAARATLLPRDVQPAFSRSEPAGAAPDYEPALWRPSPNINARPAGAEGREAMIIIHTCEGSYAGCWSWLANPVSQVSAHYVVNGDGSEITQLVRESDRAWHIGARYECGLNSGWECWRNDVQSNHFTVGIEHAGFAAQSSFDGGQIDASAKLVCDITRRQGISRDRLHIVAHGQLQPQNRTDPGPNWPWADYLERIRTHCGDPLIELIIDGDNRFNDTTFARAAIPAEWTGASSTAGFWGIGYHHAPTSSSSNAAAPAQFRFFLPAPATRTIEAWWTGGNNRSPDARFEIAGADAFVIATPEANQQQRGGEWNELGTWSFPAGWNTVRLTRAGEPGCVVVADAVRVK